MKSWLQKMKGNVLPAALAAGFTALVFIDTSFLNNGMLKFLWIAAAILFGLMCLLAYAGAGYAVMHSLVKIGAGISLVFFVGEAYCSSGGRTEQADSALVSLIVLGIAYLLYDFVGKLSSLLNRVWDQIKKDKPTPGGYVFIALFAVFTLSLLWAVALVFTPIVNGICVFQSAA